ncbi:hypothetical protein DMENIID0001_002800 [Sergentomyia squamirostris]
MTEKRKGENGNGSTEPATKQTKLDYWLALPTSNRFDSLPQEETNNDVEMPEKNPPKPPPVFVHGVEQILPLKTLLDSIAKDDYTHKALHDNTVKIQVNKIEQYRLLLQTLREKKTDMHSYQPKIDRSFRVIIKGLHHSTDTNEIKSALKALGHTVKNVHNVRDRHTKHPLSIFYVDLQAASGNKTIYDVNRLLSCVVRVEPPHHKKEIVQCTNCQRYGHTKSFCNRPPRCIKCTIPHSTASCPRNVKDVNVMCVNCGGNHPANYRGCSVHEQLRKKLHQNLRTRINEARSPKTNTNVNSATLLPNLNSVELNGQMTYAEMTKHGVSAAQLHPRHEPTGSSLTPRQDDLAELKQMMKALMEQMSTIRHPDGRARGGTAIIIRKNIKHILKTPSTEEYLQATTVEVDCWGSPTTIASVYCPPRYNISRQQLESFFNGLGPKFIACGDYNAKHTHWGSRLANPRGRELFEVLRKKSYGYLSSGEPTYWPSDPNKHPDLLDFGVTCGINTSICLVKSSLDLSSDHTPVIVDIFTDIVKIPSPCTLYNRKTDWNIFRHNLDDKMTQLQPPSSPGEVDCAIEKLTTAIQTAAWEATPIFEREPFSYQTSQSISEKIREKRSLRRRWHYTKHPEDKKRFNKATKELNTLLKDMKNASVEKYLSNLSPTAASDYSLWKATKKFNRPQISHAPIRKGNGEWARNDQDKANLFADHLKNVFQPWPATSATSVISAPVQSPQATSVKRFKLNELINVIMDEINTKKAPGWDLITGRILRELSAKCCFRLLMIFNATLKLGYYPLQWKVAQVVMVPKLRSER